jgi:hypothetical protein
VWKKQTTQLHLLRKYESCQRLGASILRACGLVQDTKRRRAVRISVIGGFRTGSSYEYVDGEARGDMSQRQGMNERGGKEMKESICNSTVMID